MSFDFQAVSGADDYLVIPLTPGWIDVHSIYRNGTTVTLTIVNPSAVAHTISAFTFYIIAYKDVSSSY